MYETSLKILIKNSKLYNIDLTGEDSEIYIEKIKTLLKFILEDSYIESISEVEYAS